MSDTSHFPLQPPPGAFDIERQHLERCKGILELIGQKKASKSLTTLLSEHDRLNREKHRLQVWCDNLIAASAMKDGVIRRLSSEKKELSTWAKGLEAWTDERLVELDRVKSALQEQISGLKKDTDTLKQENSTLKQELGNLTQGREDR